LSLTKLPVNPKELYIEIVISKGMGHLTPKAAELLVALAKNAIRKKQYFNPDDKDDCFQTGLVALLAHWHNFNPEKYSNAFAYFTEVFKRGIAEGYNQLHNKRGLEKGERARTVSLNSANKGEAMFNL
jgi:DNA-directed RNA polymerase specialized sigma subunit